MLVLKIIFTFRSICTRLFCKHRHFYTVGRRRRLDSVSSVHCFLSLLFQCVRPFISPVEMWNVNLSRAWHTIMVTKLHSSHNDCHQASAIINLCTQRNELEFLLPALPVSSNKWFTASFFLFVPFWKLDTMNRHFQTPRLAVVSVSWHSTKMENERKK